MSHRTRGGGAIIQDPPYFARFRHRTIEPRSISRLTVGSISSRSVVRMRKCALRTHACLIANGIRETVQNIYASSSDRGL
ncbi:uncharacterized protein PHACADRAFT_263758 [Phanerochaete carnosa HHB-10118-sp]|uniref:Uncharacterized protein n=1 Tax=Phanerochaete carnosa (strain HHB-10118-sp) TaxID=650164 RepID=K5ULC6_PHACS|nr:uncharacterized protein PHACADRAFT_263758 [Phanerochaete carnosa HHB-10118-sp]EKM50456.1 hypothetical protein PHACADRAFT_263758 [Phanerochaete carnosa HHB-10118-sp]